MNEPESKPVNLAENNSAMRSLLALAWRIWSEGSGSVMIDDEPMRAELGPALRNGELLEDEKGLRFASELSMVQAAARYILDAEGPLLISMPKACFERLNEIVGKEIGKRDMVSGHALALLHNGSKLDAYSWGQKAIEAGVGVFDVLHVLEGAVIHFDNARAESIFQFFTEQYERVKNDLAGGLVYVKLQEWFTRHPDVAHEVKRLHEERPNESGGNLYGCALHGLIINDFIGNIASIVSAGKSLDAIIAVPAIHVLGLPDYSNSFRHTALHEVIQLCAEVVRTPGHPLLGKSVETLCRLIKHDEKAIISLLDEVGKAATPEALYALSGFLWREARSIGEKDWFWSLVRHLTSAQAEHKGILSNIDMMLIGWVRDPVKGPRVLEFLNTWISKQPSNSFNELGLEISFPSTVHRLAEQPGVLNCALTEWLLHDDSRYPLIAQKLVSRLRTEGVTSQGLDSAIIDKLSRNEIRLLLRRILGYIVGDEVQIQLVFSLAYTQNAKDRTFGFVTSALQDQVGYDYPYQTIEYLKKRQNAQDEAAEVRVLCNEIAAELQRRLDVIDALPDLKEFHPSSVKVRRFSKERQHQMNEAFEEASKDSIWRQIATQIPLKAGRRTFQSINGRYTDPTELKEMSHSIALPRSEISDPAGAARERMLYRKAKEDTP